MVLPFMITAMTAPFQQQDAGKLKVYAPEMCRTVAETGEGRETSVTGSPPAAAKSTAAKSGCRSERLMVPVPAALKQRRKPSAQ